MTQAEQQKAAKKFIEDWKGRGDEKSETHNYWIQLLRTIFDVQDCENYIEFEKRVKLDHTSFIDGYIAKTKILIEQKSLDIDLRKAYTQSDGCILTPYQQAHRYFAALPKSEIPDYIVVCNFKSFLVYDMDAPNAEPQEILLENLEKEFYRLSFLVDPGNAHLKREMELSIQAGVIVGEIYDALIKEYKDPTNEHSLKSLNMLCVRLVFCLYAEDAGIFGHKSMFHDFLNRFESRDTRKALIDLFAVLDTKEKERDPYLDEILASFPFVNGGLFTDTSIEIPNFTDGIRTLLLKNASDDFNWSEISPTIFGAVFESTLNPETRRSGGMHYTSIENIHKVIDPLFFNELCAEFETIQSTKTEKTRNAKLQEFQTKLGSLKFLDPACGSGNFLTESYLSLRKLENKCIKLRLGEHGSALDILGDDFTIQVKIHQFYGIEINDFAAVVAKTALWIAESQMMTETAKILSRNLDFLPLKSYSNIVEGNALRIDWATLRGVESPLLQPASQVSATPFAEDTLAKPSCPYDYIMGNPPFVGARLMSKPQKDDILSVFGADWKNIGNLDYVCAWYKKASELIKDTNTKAALVSTNSVCQGDSVANLWKPLMENGVHINFAWRTFRWDSESTLKAHVHCVIVGFSTSYTVSKTIFNESGIAEQVKNINGYLIDADNIAIDSRKSSICNVPEIFFGNMPNDGGNLIVNAEEYEDFIKQEPEAKKYIHKFLGAEEFINKKDRYCLWLLDASPAEIKKMTLVYKRVQNVKKMREESKRAATNKLAEIPYLFGEIRQPKEGNYILIPSTSSERRRYIPIGFFDYTVITSNANMIIPNAGLYEFGILTSNVHMAWMRAVCGRLEMRYRYSNTIVYNNFPWCTPTAEQKTKIEQTTQAILDARALFPESSLADLYDETLMPQELRKAHQENDKAVMAAYGFNLKMTESECVAELFKMYEKLTKRAELNL